MSAQIHTVAPWGIGVETRSKETLGEEWNGVILGPVNTWKHEKTYLFGLAACIQMVQPDSVYLGITWSWNDSWNK